MIISFLANILYNYIDKKIGDYMINIRTDSRKVKKGDIFVALRGIVGDGHDFIPMAIEKGASKIIAEEGEYSIPFEIVKDTREYLNDYLRKNYNKYLEEMHIIGITGTNGKTTTAFLIYDALNKLGKKCCYAGTIGYYRDKKVFDMPNTTPEVTEIYDMLISAYDEGYRYAVIEASSEGLLHKRLENVPFEYAIFTNLTQDHLNIHGTMENYAKCKQKLFNNIRSGGKAIINYDDPNKDMFVFNYNTNITYGFTGGDYKVNDYQMNILGSNFTLVNDGVKQDIKVPLIGKYNIYNALCCIITLYELGFTYSEITDVMKKVSSPPGRMDMVEYKNNRIIIDYAHTPDAVQNVISTVKEVCDGNIYTVFGCTGDRDRTKRPIMTKLVTDMSTSAIITCDDIHNEDPNRIVDDMLEGITNKNYEIDLDRKEAIIKGIKLLTTNDCLLILGKGHEEVMIVKDNKRIPFNDKKTVLDYLETKKMIRIEKIDD